MSWRITAKVAAAAVGVAVLAVAASYLAAALYFLAIKSVPGEISWHTYPDILQAAEGTPFQTKARGAGIIAAAAFLAMLGSAVVGSRRGRPLHGDARWATESEVKAGGLLADRGIVLGRLGRRFLMMDGEEFALLAAPIRSGKGVSCVIPNCLNWHDSLVALDIKCENYEMTSGFRAKAGQEVFLFNPFDGEGSTHRWNPLDAVRSEARYRIGDILEIATCLYPTDLGVGGANSSEVFFAEQAQNLFMGLAMLVLETPTLPHTIGEIYRQGSGAGQAVDRHLRQVLATRTDLTSGCVNALNRFLSNSDNTLASIKSSFEAPLLIFANPITDCATSRSDFDLTDLRRKRMTIYVGIPPNRLTQGARLLNLFWTQLINRNTDVLPSHDPNLKHQVLLVMDEFTAPGKMAVMTKAAAFFAGYGLRLLPIIQSTSQLEHVYGREDARAFVSNMGVQIYFAPREQRDASDLSEVLGYSTAEGVSRGRSHSAAGWGNSSRSETVSDQKRALLLPQEVRELGKDRLIVVRAGVRPVLADKIRYYDDPAFAHRLLAAPAVPKLDIAGHVARVEGRVRAADASSLNVEDLALNRDAIPRFSDTGEVPSQEEVGAVVEAFFSQLEWEPVEAAQQNTVTRPRRQSPIEEFAARI